MPSATMNNTLRFLESGETSSSGTFDGILRLKNSTSIAIGKNPSKNRTAIPA
jgi:hypothetical protein